MSAQEEVLLIASVAQGKIKGQLETDRNNGKFLSFYGIPYAKPPVGELRFKDPVPPDSWTGVRDGSKEQGPCYSPQPDFASLSDVNNSDGLKMNLAGSEDCLYLNLFTRKLRENTDEPLKPVMVWIHGGAFTMGSTTKEMHGPEYLMTRDIVLVIVEFRAGALGFLSLEGQRIGNAGLKDMVQALRWVKENISQFGGDQDNVTVFGVSAGGASVHYLMLSPLTKGLMHRAIAQSGSALNPWARGQQDNAISLARILGFKELTDHQKVLKFLQSLSVDEILEGQKKLGDHLTPEKVRFFSPTMEPPSDSAFIDDEPLELIRSGRFNHIPFIIGYTSQEGLMAPMLKAINICDAPCTDFVPYFLGYKQDEEAYKTAREQISKFYCGQDTADIENNKTALYTVVTDILFFRGIYMAVKAHAVSSTQPVYLYKMTADSEFNVMKTMLKLDDPGACHGDDMGYLFKLKGALDMPPGSAGYKISERFIKLWTSFAKTGNPTPSVDEDLDGVVWEPVHGEQVNFLEIDSTLKIGVDPEPERMSFWDELLRTVPGY